MTRTPARKGGAKVNPRLLSQLEAAIERGDGLGQALKSLGINHRRTQKLYTEALMGRGDSPYTPIA